MIAGLNLFFWVVAIIVYIVRLFGVNFIPAPNGFFSEITWLPWAIGGALAAPFAFFLLRMSVLSINDFMGRLYLLATGLFAFFMTGFAVQLSFRVAIPMVHTAINGENGFIEYTVATPTGTEPSFRTNCYSSVEVNVSVFGYSNLCDVPNSFRRQLRKESRINVYGRASSTGIFYNRFDLGGY